MLLDFWLLLEQEVAAMASRTFVQDYLALCLHPFLDQEAPLVLTYTPVTSCLDPCNTLYMWRPSKTPPKRQPAQNMMVHVIWVSPYIATVLFQRNSKS